MRYHYYVQPYGDQWRLTDGNGNPTYYRTQGDAAAIGRQSAQRDYSLGHNAQVQVARPNGRWRTEWTYGNDPARYPS
jgi:hypothetical protein